MKKIFIKVLIVIAAVILIGVIAALCLWNFWIKPKYSDQLMEAVNVIMEDEELMNEISEVLSDEQVQSEISEAMGDEQMQADIAAAIGDVQIPQDMMGAESGNDAPGGNDAPSAAQSTSASDGHSTGESTAAQPRDKTAAAPQDNTAQSASSGTSAPQQQSGSDTPASAASAAPQSTDNGKKTDTSGKSAMELAKENVSPKDMAEGMKIASKIDIGYLSGLAKGGITEDEKKEAKEHLKGNLSSEEISELKTLIGKYSYLLEK